MSDEMNNISPGAIALAKWAAAAPMTWKQLREIASTRRAKVMKDPDAERGRLICAVGPIIEIQVHHSAIGDIAEGGLMDGNGNFYRFLNVGSSGDLVERSQASVCGVTIGKMSYSNSMGGTAHAVQLVGMFDLAENRRVAR